MGFFCLVVCGVFLLVFFFLFGFIWFGGGFFVFVFVVFLVNFSFPQDIKSSHFVFVSGGGNRLAQLAAYHYLGFS